MGTLIGVGLFTLAAVPILAVRFGLDCFVWFHSPTDKRTSGSPSGFSTRTIQSGEIPVRSRSGSATRFRTNWRARRRRFESRSRNS